MNSLFVILTAVLSSGVIAALTSVSLTDAKERWGFRRQKIEELYLSAAKWLREVDGQYLIYLRVAKGQITYNQALDSVLKDGGTAKDTGDLHLRMQMTISMYEPSLMPYLKSLEREQRKTNRLIFKIRDVYSETGEATDLFDIYNAQLIRFGDAGDKLKEEIVRRGAIIASEPTQVIAMFRSMRDSMLILYGNTRIYFGSIRKSIRAKWSRPDDGNPPGHTTDPDEADRGRQ